MDFIKEILDFKFKITEDIVITVYNLLILFITLIVAGFFVKLIKRGFRTQEQRGKIEIGKSRAMFQVIRYIIWIIAITVILKNFGFSLTIILAGSAALLVGLGLALQQIFQDFMCGITLIIEGSIKVGDVIETTDGEVSIVREIGLRTSQVETRDSIIRIVPNSKLVNDQVINWSHNELRTRFKVSVGVAYGSDVKLVTKLLKRCAEEHPRIANTKPAQVLFTDFGDSSLNFDLLFYTTETFQVEFIKSELRYAIEKAFKENGVSIPFPQRDIHIIK